MPNDDEISNDVAAIARRALGLEGALEASTRLVEDLGLDSLRMLTLSIEVENHFRVRLDPPDEGAIETVGDLVRVIRGKLEETP